MNILINVEGVSKNYDGLQILKKTNIRIARGEFVVILGKSGAGKSTFLNLLGGLEKPDTGLIEINDKDIVKMSESEMEEFRKKEIGFVFQFYNLIEELTIFENIELARKLANSALDIDSLLDKLGILSQKNKYPSELSGGQQQRVSIGRALIKNPDILFCDEPTGALDSKSSSEVMDLLTKINKENNTTVILVTHDEEFIKLSSVIIKFKDGEITDVVYRNRKDDASL